MCNEIPTGLVVPNLSVSLNGIQTNSQVVFTQPIELNAGSCGIFKYEIFPNPELFTVVGQNIEVLGMPSPNWLGTN